MRKVLLLLWALAVLIPSTYLMGGHLLALPLPPADAPLPTGAGRWRTVHALSQECGCSRRIIAHLLDRRAFADVDETVLLVGQSTQSAEALRAVGYTVELLDEQALHARYSVESVPLFRVVDGGGHVRYSGGYTERKRGPNVRDVSIVQTLLRGDVAEELPLFGCAVSQRLKTAVDPLGIK